MNKKKISVIMGTYNCEATLKDSIDSILNQTYANWKFIICDDCSTDNTYGILEKYKNMYPEKFLLIKNEKNSKLAYSLNQCLKYADGYYIARMDGDDISLPNRFDNQIKFLQNNKNVDLVGTSMQRFDHEGINDILYVNEDPNKYSLKKGSPFNHATIMTYKYVYEDLNGYTVAKRTERAQDYDLWFKFFHKGFNGKNLIEPLYLVREDINAIRRRTFSVRFNAYKTTLIGYRLLHYPLSWYIKPTFSLLKGLVPSNIILIYRNYQKKKFMRVPK